MARQRASQARDAFARVGTAPVGAFADDDASIPASGNTSVTDGQQESRRHAGPQDGSQRSEMSQRIVQGRRQHLAPRSPKMASIPLVHVHA